MIYHKPRGFLQLFCFFFHQLSATIIPGCDDEALLKDTAEPASKENQDLATINYHTLNGLREESQPKEMQSATKQGSASQEVGELISTCVTLTRIKTTQCALSKPETEWHLCALKLLLHLQH